MAINRQARTVRVKGPDGGQREAPYDKLIKTNAKAAAFTQEGVEFAEGGKLAADLILLSVG